MNYFFFQKLYFFINIVKKFLIIHYFVKAIPVTVSTDEAKRKATYEAVKNNTETDSVHKKVILIFMLIQKICMLKTLLKKDYL